MKYRVSWAASVDITIDETGDILSRTETEDWIDSFYTLNKDDAIEMLARCCGVYGSNVNQLDGWADLENEHGVQINDVSFNDPEVELLP